MTEPRRISDAELEELKARNPVETVAGWYVTLRRAGGRIVGPCPICSANKAGRKATKFEVKPAENTWVCATGCGGGDVIKLVQLAEGLDFRAAIERLGGTREIDQEAARTREEAAKIKRDRRDREAAQFRERERGTVYRIWRGGREAAGSPVEAYLAGRGLVLPDGIKLRCFDQMPYYASGARDAVAIHRGPAMLAPIIGINGKFAALHITWLDPERDGEKVTLLDPETRETLPAKKVRGSKAAGRIALTGPAEPTRLIIGEGIETTLSVWRALMVDEQLGVTTAFWSAVDLGNLGGKAAETVAHPTAKSDAGRAIRVPGPVPDLEAPSIPIPDSVTEIILLGDGDSDRFTTECALARAADRYRRPGRTIKAAWAPDGTDWNDVLRGRVPDVADPLALIRAAIAQADEVAMPSHGDAAAIGETESARERGRLSSPPAAAADSRPASQPSDALSSLDASARGPSAAGADEKDRPSQSGGSAEIDAEERAEARRREEEIRRAALNIELAGFAMTDLGNVERFRKRFGHLFKWCPAWGWVHWDERRWARKGANERVRIAVHETARAIQDEAKAAFQEAQDLADELGDEVVALAVKKKAEPKGKRKKKKAELSLDDLEPRTLMMLERYKRMRSLGVALADWGLDSEMNAKLTPVEKHGAPYLTAEIEAFDVDPWKINFANGTLVIDKEAKGYVRFEPHNPDDLITKISPVKYDPNALAPQFLKFLARVQPDESQRRFLMAWFGYSLTGDTSEQQLVLLHGAGRNGKGALVRIVAHIAGDYAKATPIETFLAEGAPRNASQPTPERAALPGVRFLHTTEPKKGSVMDEAFIKQVTGGDKVSARDLNKSQFEFDPAFKVTISGNHKPAIKDQTESIWRRMNVVPFDVIIPEGEEDLSLDDKLRAEASGVLNLLLDGLRDRMDNGLVKSEQMKNATDTYRADNDPLGRFLADCVVFAPGERVQSKLLYDLFIAWARANGAKEWTHPGFTNAMKERDFETEKSSVMFFTGIKMVRKVSDFLDDQGNARVISDTPNRRNSGEEEGMD